MVRDFAYNEEELEAGKNEIKKLDADKKKQFVSVLQLILCNQSICTCMVTKLPTLVHRYSWDSVWC